MEEAVVARIAQLQVRAIRSGSDPRAQVGCDCPLHDTLRLCPAGARPALGAAGPAAPGGDGAAASCQARAGAARRGSHAGHAGAAEARAGHRAAAAPGAGGRRRPGQRERSGPGALRWRVRAANICGRAGCGELNQHAAPSTLRRRCAASCWRRSSGTAGSGSGCCGWTLQKCSLRRGPRAC